MPPVPRDGKGTGVMPERIQLRRTKGWRKPGAVNVARPTKWGNPWKVQRSGSSWMVAPTNARFSTEAEATECAVRWFRFHVGKVLDMGWNTLGFSGDDLSELRGKDLACWCPEGAPCHADVLLEVANA